MSQAPNWIRSSFEANSDFLLFFTIDEGNISCSAPGQTASVDSWLSCVLFQLPFFLESIGFGFICFPLTLMIIAISIFGSIKENYRWFILNQACWDFLILYNFLCDKPSFSSWFSRYLSLPDIRYGEWYKRFNQGQ